MANHCIEVGCLECGHCFCARGCGLEEVKAGNMVNSNDKCSKCGAEMVMV
jgi:hypothetical protein